ncbi:MAG: 3-methyl-2-oxobutanoate hydroxymethyltransferase [Lentisphaeria bacterium]|nr:3-methyl-2-oxobutanoate hydroxymethyltransferase [Lentisphaeria bacterium]
MSSQVQPEKIGVKELRKMVAEKRAIVAVTAYDALMARMADEAGVDLILVGDSLGMTMLGYKTTIPVTMRDILHHTSAVVRGVTRAMVVADMPFMTYHTSQEDAMRNAAVFLQEGGADAVKLEGGQAVSQTVERLVVAGVPVLGHIGILPQSVLSEGGYHVQGRTPEGALKLLADARAIQDAGAFGIVLEGLPGTLSVEISEELEIPTIGIGAGPGCDGQIQVLHDILGLFEDFVPKHTKRYAELATDIRQAVAHYRSDVCDGVFPGEEQTFK